MKMSVNNSVDDSHVADGDRNAEVQGVEQFVPRTIFDAMDQRVRRIEGRLEDLIERFDAMAVETNRDRDIGGRRSVVRDAYGGPIN